MICNEKLDLNIGIGYYDLYFFLLDLAVLTTPLSITRKENMVVSSILCMYQILATRLDKPAAYINNFKK